MTGAAGGVGSLAVALLAGLDYEVTAAWKLTAKYVDHAKLEKIAIEIGLSQVIDYSASVLDDKVQGRTVVDVNR